MNPVDQLRQDLLGMGLAATTIAGYSAIAQKFLKGVSGQPDRHTVLKHLGDLRTINAPANTRNVHYYALRALFNSQGWAFDVPPPRGGNEEEINRPILSRDQVLSMIRWTRAEGSPEQQAYLALSTTFGLRRCELSQLTDTNFDDGKLMVWTQHRGTPRKHTMPDAVDRVVSSLQVWEPLSASYASMLIKTIFIQSGQGFQKGFGWHSIRRALFTELLSANVNLLVAMRFMRWKIERTPIRMADVYANFADGQEDQIVFESHPFLQGWEISL